MHGQQKHLQDISTTHNHNRPFRSTFTVLGETVIDRDSSTARNPEASSVAGKKYRVTEGEVRLVSTSMSVSPIPRQLKCSSVSVSNTWHPSTSTRSKNPESRGVASTSIWSHRYDEFFDFTSLTLFPSLIVQYMVDTLKRETIEERTKSCMGKQTRVFDGHGLCTSDVSAGITA